LPTQARFSSDAAFKNLAGPNSWNQQQGFYIYRANRMIQSGGWSRMRAPDEHTKFARVALDFFPELDAAFGINIAKMRVNLPQQLTTRLKEPIEDLIRSAKRAYSAKEPVVGGAPKAKPADRAPIAPAPKPAPRPTISALTKLPVSGGLAAAASGAPIAWPPPPLQRRKPCDALLAAAQATGDIDALNRIAVRVREVNPEVADELGW
jgi:hypothetical protein